MSAPALVALLVVVASPALAQPTLPTRDVAIVYKVAGGAHEAIPGGLPDTVRVAWNAARQLIRVEPEGRPQPCWSTSRRQAFG